MAKMIFHTPIYLDEKNQVYFKGIEDNKEIRVTPEQEGFSKSLELTVFIRREKTNDDFVKEFAWFRGTILVKIENERRYRFFYLKQTRHTKVPMLCDLEGSYGSQISISDPEFSSWKAKPKKMSEDEIAPDPQNQLCYSEDANGLRRILPS